MEPTVDLDDQLAALAAGELDAEQARALTARVASDPALARRLARITRLDTMLHEWQTPEMSSAAAMRMDAALTDALDALPDAPLVGAADARPVVTPLPGRGDASDRDTQPDATAATAATDELATARARRTAPSVPRWVAVLGAAAAAVVVAGGGAQLLGGFSTVDSGDPMASQSINDAEMDSIAGTELSGSSFVQRTGLTLTAASLGELADDSAVAQRRADWASAPLTTFESTVESGATVQQDGIDASDATTTTNSTISAAQDSMDSMDSASITGATTCLSVALTDPNSQVLLVGEGTYEGEVASFVVVLRYGDNGTEVIATLAYDASCTLLAERTR
jgi:hypothetical protein